MKIIEVIRKAILKRKRFTHEKTVNPEEAARVHQYLESVRRTAEQLRAAGFSNEEIMLKLAEGIKDEDETR